MAVSEKFEAACQAVGLNVQSYSGPCTVCSHAEWHAGDMNGVFLYLAACRQGLQLPVGSGGAGLDSSGVIFCSARENSPAGGPLGPLDWKGVEGVASGRGEAERLRRPREQARG